MVYDIFVIELLEMNIMPIKVDAQYLRPNLTFI